MRRIDYIVVHCTATPQTTTIASIIRYWQDVLKWKSPGYHYIVSPLGNLTQLQSDDRLANGVKGHNANSIHISYIGGVDVNNRPLDNRTEAQKVTLAATIERLKRKYPTAKVMGHRDFPGVRKACPSFDAKKEYTDL